MSMMNSIEQAVRPLFLMCHIFGLGIYISKSYFNTLYNVTVWCVYSYLFYYTMFAVNAEKWFLATSTLICNGINSLVSITSVIMSLHQYKVHICSTLKLTYLSWLIYYNYNKNINIY